MRLYWNERTAGDELRFHVGSYRRGLGPWVTQHIVHDLVARYGIAFRWRGNWRLSHIRVRTCPPSLTNSARCSARCRPGLVQRPVMSRPATGIGRRPNRGAHGIRRRDGSGSVFASLLATCSPVGSVGRSMAIHQGWWRTTSNPTRAMRCCSGTKTTSSASASHVMTGR